MQLVQQQFKTGVFIVTIDDFNGYPWVSIQDTDGEIVFSGEPRLLDGLAGVITQTLTAVKEMQVKNKENNQSEKYPVL